MKLLLSLGCLLFLAGIVHMKEPVTIYLAGDSTVAEKLPEKRPETGWGEMLQPFFKNGEVRVVNHAKNGRSTRTFIQEKLWQGIQEQLRPGDYVFIQFGHNDESKEKQDRYTSPEDYRKNLTMFVEDTRAKGAFPVLLTPVMRRRFDAEGHFYDTHGEYPDIVRSVARDRGVPLIDMHRKSEQFIKSLGVEESKKLFLWLKPNENSNYPQGIEDNTHFNRHGAQMMAALVARGIKELKLGLSALVSTGSEPGLNTR